MPDINPDILIWARETAGLTLEEAARGLDVRRAFGQEPVERLREWESGGAAPTRLLLKKMSEKYRRPLLSFYLSKPPRREGRGEDFRTLPASFSLAENALVDAAIREIKVRQLLVRSALEDEDEAEVLAFVGSADLNVLHTELADNIKQELAFDNSTYRKSRTISDAVKYLRGKIESVGIFVLIVGNLGSDNTKIPVDLFRGFALADRVAPFVAVNANDSKGAQAFTIVHELTHLWLGSTGVSGPNGNQDIERFCNDVAGEFLLPAAELTQLAVTEETDFRDAVNMIHNFAGAHRVSKTMVAYRLHRSGAFSGEHYVRIARIFRQSSLGDRQRTQQSNGSPSYHAFRRHRAGPSLVGLVRRMHGSGTITTTKAGKILGVSAKSVQRLLGSSGHSA